MKDNNSHISNFKGSQDYQIPEHSIVKSIDIQKQSNEQWVVNLYCSYMLSNALQFNLFEEIPLIKGTYQNVEDVLKNILGTVPMSVISELNIFFNDCHVVVLKEESQNIISIIEDILCNLFQHLPNISTYEDLVPEVVYIPLQINGKKAYNSCFKKWGLYYPNESELMIYTLEDRSLVAMESKNISMSK